MVLQFLQLIFSEGFLQMRFTLCSSSRDDSSVPLSKKILGVNKFETFYSQMLIQNATSKVK